MNEKVKDIIKFVSSYIISIIAGIIYVMLMLNIISILSLTYVASTTARGVHPWSLSLINMVSALILGLVGVIYFFLTFYRLTKDSKISKKYVYSILKLVLPVMVLYILSEVYLRFSLYMMFI